ncbi:hypothetical protein BH23ACI1_BH23ACI1_32760 [soil metagenome]
MNRLRGTRVCAVVLAWAGTPAVLPAMIDKDQATPRLSAQEEARREVRQRTADTLAALRVGGLGSDNAERF